MDSAEIELAAQQLALSSYGRDALSNLLSWLDGSGLSLDGQNQQAVLTLLQGAWGGLAGTTRDAMREALAGE